MPDKNEWPELMEMMKESRGNAHRIKVTINQEMPEPNSCNQPILLILPEETEEIPSPSSGQAEHATEREKESHMETNPEPKTEATETPQEKNPSPSTKPDPSVKYIEQKESDRKPGASPTLKEVIESILPEKQFDPQVPNENLASQFLCKKVTEGPSLEVILSRFIKTGADAGLMLGLAYSRLEYSVGAIFGSRVHPYITFPADWTDLERDSYVDAVWTSIQNAVIDWKNCKPNQSDFMSAWEIAAESLELQKKALAKTDAQIDEDFLIGHLAFRALRTAYEAKQKRKPITYA